MLRKSISAKARRRRQASHCIEPLESRTLLSVATVNAGTTVRTVPSNFLGVNTAPWDGLLSNATTLSLSQAAGISSVRIGGGSWIDGTSGDPNGWHFDVNNQCNTLPAQLAFITGLNATGIIDLNYGTASPQEDAAELAYLNAPINTPAIDNVSIGAALHFTGTAIGNGTLTGGWAAGGGVNANGTTSWQTVGFWASLRAATPLAQDDGLNFLRIGRSAPLGFHYYEISNEDYGSWEADAQGLASSELVGTLPGGATPKAHDPTTIIAFSKQFQLLANQIDPTISIGIDSQDTTSSWISGILTQSVSQGFTLGYIADHYYTSANPSSPSTISDSTLLGTPNTSVSGNSYDITQRVNAYDALINSLYVTPLGAGANKPQVLIDEFNSISSQPGKQSTSLVNALFVADALGAALNTTGSNGLGGAQGVWLWDLHNGPASGSPAPDEATTLYGWRTNTNWGDYGILGSGNAGAGTGSGTNVEYPDYFAIQMASKLIQAGGTVVAASEDNETSVDTYAVLEPNGHLDLLVINKAKSTLGTAPNNLPAPTLTEQFTINGFSPSSQATLWQYGPTEDDAQSTSPFATSLTHSNITLGLSNGSFSIALPAYSMTLLDLTSGPSIVNVAAASPNPITATSTSLSVLAQENGNDTGLTYSWSATGPATVSYSPNNSSKNTTAIFTKAGNYSFTATVTDAANQTITSTVNNVIVNQTLTAIAVSPGTATVPNGQTEPFSASATDQFGNAMSATLNWSLDTGGGGSIGSASGIYTAPSSGVGTATARATSGTVSGTAAVTVQLTTIAGTSGNDTIRLLTSGSSLNVYINNPTTPAYSALLSSLGALTVIGGGGSDQIIIDFSGTSAPMPTSGLNVDGTGGSANLSIVGTSGDDTATVTADTITFNASPIHYINIASIAINSGAGNDTLTQSAQPAVPLTFSGGSTDTLNVNAGIFTFPAPSIGAGIEPMSLNALSIAAGATVSLPTASVSTDRTLLLLSSLLNSGLLDLGGNDLILHAGDPELINGQIAQGFNHGFWNGSTGITSSAAAASTATALGIELNDDGTVDHKPLMTSFDGQPVTSTDVLVKYTFVGDADLSGSVDAGDYLLIDAGFTSGSGTWRNGDFNYDGVINGDDYALIDNAFNTQGSASFTAVPATLIANDTTPPPTAAKTTASSSIRDVTAPIGDASELKKRRHNIWTALEETDS